MISVWQLGDLEFTTYRWCFRKERNTECIFFLQGFAIGNGLTDPAIQYGAYADYALEMGIISQRAHSSITKIYPLCQRGIELCGIWLFLISYSFNTKVT